MNTNTVLLLALSGVATYFVSKFLFRADDRAEDRKRRAIDLSNWCTSNGLPGLAELLSSYAVSDYSAVLHQVRTLGNVLGDPAASSDVVNRFLKTQLDKKLSTAEGREELVAYVEAKFNIKIPRDLLVDSKIELTPVVPANEE